MCVYVCVTLYMCHAVYVSHCVCVTLCMCHTVYVDACVHNRVLHICMHGGCPQRHTQTFAQTHLRFVRVRTLGGSSCTQH